MNDRLLTSCTLRLFHWKTFCKYNFMHFSVFGSTKKTGQRKTIFSQRKTLIKIRLIFYRLFSKKFFWKTISLSLITSPINIIFCCSDGKQIFWRLLSLIVSSLTFSLFSFLFLQSYILCFEFQACFFSSLRNFRLMDSRQKLL